MIRFAYSLIPVGFRAILIFCHLSFFSFSSQKKYSVEFLRPEITLSRRFLRKCSIWSPPPPPPNSIINLSFFKKTIKSELLRVGGYYFQDFHNPMIPATGKNFKKIHEVRVTCPGWFNTELPNEAFYSLSNPCYDHCKNVFNPFS